MKNKKGLIGVVIGIGIIIFISWLFYLIYVNAEDMKDFCVKEDGIPLNMGYSNKPFECYINNTIYEIHYYDNKYILIKP